MTEPSEVHYAVEGEISMRSAVYESWTDANGLKVVNNIASPQDLSKKEENVVVKVHSSSINPIDWKLRRGDMKMVISGHFPKIPGRDLSGEIVAVGSKVTRFVVGDKVFGMPEKLIGTSCEFVNCSEKSLSKIPSNLNETQAAGIPLVALTAWEGLYDHGKLTSGQSVLVLGGSSSVGIYAVQLAKWTGAKVIATCGTDKIDFVKSLGADQCIDYRNEDVQKVLENNHVDLVMDAVGYKEGRDKAFHVIKKGGILVTTTPNDHEKPLTVVEGLKTGVDIVAKKVSNYVSHGVSYIPFLVKDHGGVLLDKISELIQQGKVKTVEDSVFPLDQITQAHLKSESGKTKGKIIVNVSM